MCLWFGIVCCLIVCVGSNVVCWFGYVGDGRMGVDCWGDGESGECVGIYGFGEFYLDLCVWFIWVV